MVQLFWFVSLSFRNSPFGCLRSWRWKSYRGCCLSGNFLWRRTWRGMGDWVGHLILCGCCWRCDLIWLGRLSLHGLAEKSAISSEDLDIFSLDIEWAWCFVFLYNNGGFHVRPCWTVTGTPTWSAGRALVPRSWYLFCLCCLASKGLCTPCATFRCWQPVF